HHRPRAQRPRHRLFRIAVRPVHQCADLSGIGPVPCGDPITSQCNVVPTEQPGRSDASGSDGGDPVFTNRAADYPDAHPDGIRLYIRDRSLHNPVSGLWEQNAGVGPSGGRLSLVLAWGGLALVIAWSRI